MTLDVVKEWFWFLCWAVPLGGLSVGLAIEFIRMGLGRVKQ